MLGLGDRALLFLADQQQAEGLAVLGQREAQLDRWIGRALIGVRRDVGHERCAVHPERVHERTCPIDDLVGRRVAAL